MKFTVEFKNFGKIKDGKVQFNDLTILAGNNSTGKSYISRTLYCIFDALTNDPQRRYYSKVVENFISKLEEVKGPYINLGGNKINVSVNTIDDIIDEFIKKVSDIELQIDSIENGYADNGNERREQYFMDLLQPLLKQEQATTDTVRESCMSASGFDNSEASAELQLDMAGHMTSLEKAFSFFKGRLQESYENKIERGYLILIKEKLIDNFQVTSLQNLRGANSNEDCTINLDFNHAKVSIKIDAKGKLTGDVKVSNSNFMSNAIYLASPVYWSIQNPVSKIPTRKMIGKRQYLGGIPQYIHDSYKTLGYESIDNETSAVDNLVKDIEETIGGEIKYDSLQSKLEFFEEVNGGESRRMSLLLTANGIVQLGMLAFFIKNRTIAKGTVLFVDEPEAHLHTEWQDKIMQVLYTLKQYGVKVIIATHSSTMMQRLELQVNTNRSQNEVALNLCTKDGKFGNGSTDFETINKEIARSMNEAPYQIFLEVE